MHALLLTLTLVTHAMPAATIPGRVVVQPVAMVLTAPAAMTTQAAPAAVASDQQTQPQPAPPQINVEVKRGSGGWWANPVWVAIGAIAAVVVILLIVMAARGGGSGGTTVVRG